MQGMQISKLLRAEHRGKPMSLSVPMIHCESPTGAGILQRCRIMTPPDGYMQPDVSAIFLCLSELSDGVMLGVILIVCQWGEGSLSGFPTGWQHQARDSGTATARLRFTRGSSPFKRRCDGAGRGSLRGSLAAREACGKRQA